MDSWWDTLLYWLQLPFRRCWQWLKSLMMLTGLLVWLSVALMLSYTGYLLKDIPASAEMSMDSVQQLAHERLNMKLQLQRTSPQSQLPQASPWLPLDQISRDLLYSIVLSEDADFFTHQGIDYHALQSALGENIKRREWAFGASTISQQTAKNLFLDHGKALSRKFQELVATRRLEQALSKNQILEVYLNVAEFGPNLYGVRAASEYYFQTTPDRLNAAQGAFLALLLPSPRRYHYSLVTNGNWSPALRRKMQRILKDMRFKEFISAKQYQDYRQWQYSGLPERIVTPTSSIKTELASGEKIKKKSG